MNIKTPRISILIIFIPDDSNNEITADVWLFYRHVHFNVNLSSQTSSCRRGSFWLIRKWCHTVNKDVVLSVKTLLFAPSWHLKTQTELRCGFRWGSRKWFQVRSCCWRVLRSPSSVCLFFFFRNHRIMNIKGTVPHFGKFSIR